MLGKHRIVLMAAAWAALAMAACSGSSGGRDPVQRGELLTRGCHACHSPKIFTPEGEVIDSTRVLSGHPEELGIPDVDLSHVNEGWITFNDQSTCWVGPWGMAFARNLTPDEETGIGTWNEETFIRLVRAGHRLRGEQLAKPMPWLDLRKSSDEDLRAIFAYLRSIPPVKNHVPGTIPLAELETGDAR